MADFITRQVSTQKSYLRKNFMTTQFNRSHSVILYHFTLWFPSFFESTVCNLLVSLYNIWLFSQDHTHYGTRDIIHLDHPCVHVAFGSVQLIWFGWINKYKWFYFWAKELLYSSKYRQCKNMLWILKYCNLSYFFW